MRTKVLMLLFMGSFIQGTVKEMTKVPERRYPYPEIKSVRRARMPAQSLNRIEEASVRRRYCDFSWLWRLCSGQRR